MSHPSTPQILAATPLGLALPHNFSTKPFERQAHRHPRHAGPWHLPREIELALGFWALMLMLCMFAAAGKAETTAYLDSRNFIQPLFVFAIMVIAGIRPILQSAGDLVQGLAAPLPDRHQGMARYLLLLAFVPSLGSFVTGPAGISILRGRSDDGAISPLGQLLGALPPTLLAVPALRLR